MVHKKNLFLYNISRNRKGAMLMEKQEEIWKDIVIEKNGVLYDYTGLYQVSNLGRVRSLNYRGKGRIGIMHPTKRDDGYYVITLHKNSEQQYFRLHRLVATAFLPNPDRLPDVNHKDENPGNNCLENLEWCTKEYNMNYGTRGERAGAKISKVLIGKKRMDVAERNSKKVQCVETGQIFECIKDAEKWCGKAGVGACCKGKQATAGGYHWKYYNENN